jgi:hypothetical protein
VRALRDEVTRLSDKDQLLAFARRWLYDHKLLIEHDRALRAQIGSAFDQLERQTHCLMDGAVFNSEQMSRRSTLQFDYGRWIMCIGEEASHNGSTTEGPYL